MKKTKKNTSLKQTSKKKPAKSITQMKIAENIWPVERDVLFRPDRLKYVRKLIQPEGCVFCTAENNKSSFETLCLYKSKHSMIVLNKFPYNNGHLLIMPRRHCGELLKLSDVEYADLFLTQKLAVQAIQEIYGPPGFNMGLNHGACAGAGIPEHLHFHLVPRWAGDVNFFPMIADTKVVIESLEQTYDRLLQFLSPLSKG